MYVLIIAHVPLTRVKILKINLKCVFWYLFPIFLKKLRKSTSTYESMWLKYFEWNRLYIEFTTNDGVLCHETYYDVKHRTPQSHTVTFVNVQIEVSWQIANCQIVDLNPIQSLGYLIFFSEGIEKFIIWKAGPKPKTTYYLSIYNKLVNYL